jgi:hypothetical protein
LQTVWEGLVDRQWTEADLDQIEGELDKLDFLADYQFAMRGEQACNLWALDYVHKTGIPGWEQVGNTGQESPGPSELEKFLSVVMFRLIPSGWLSHS